mgnify:CR=1 FL=1
MKTIVIKIKMAKKPQQEKVSASTLKEIVAQLFKVLDVNSDGKLDRDEMKTFFKNMSATHNESFNESDFEKNWDAMDCDKNNDVDQDELYNYMYLKAKADGQLAEDES